MNCSLRQEIRMLTSKMCRVEAIVKGAPFEMGMAQGEALRDKIRLAPDILAKVHGFRIMQPAWMPYAVYRRVAEQKAKRLLERPLKRDFPESHRRLEGLSAGSKTSMRLLHLVHALEPMLSDVSNCSIVPAFGACSAVAVRRSRSATNEPMIARNFDYIPLVQPLYTLRESRPAAGFRSLDFTMAPFAGAVDGVNEKGLCITYDYAFVNDFSGKGNAPVSFAISEALQRCTTVEETAAWIGSRPRWGGGILMLADAGGDIASLELSNTRSQIRRPDKGEDVIFHTNSFVTEKMKAVEVPANAEYTTRAPVGLRGCRIHESSEIRNLRFSTLLNGNQAFDEDGLARIMGDHDPGGKSGGAGICTHSDYWNTTATLQLFPVSRRMRVAFDSACNASYEDITL